MKEEEAWMLLFWAGGEDNVRMRRPESQLVTEFQSAPWFLLWPLSSDGEGSFLYLKR